MTRKRTTSILLLLVLPALSFADDYEDGVKELAKGNYSAAIRYLTNHLKNSPNDPYGNFNLGIAYLQSNEKDHVSKSLSPFRRASSHFKTPEDRAIAEYNLGLAYQHLGIRGPAEDAYKEALNLKKDLPQAKYNLDALRKKK